MTDPVDVLVIGAGPTGLSLAVQAADHGASVRVLERRREPFRPSRALIVHPRTLEVLRPLGVTGALLDRGHTGPEAHLYLGSRLVRATLDSLDLPDTPFPFLLLLPQAQVEDVLTKALADRNIEVERGREVVNVAAGVDHARATTSDGGLATARFVVGCDGPASLVRRSMAAAWPGGPYRQEVVLADIELDDDLDQRAVHAAPGPDGLVFLFALGEAATWRLLATRPASPQGARCGQPGAPVADEDLHRLLERSGLPVHLRTARWSARVPLQHRLAGSYRAGPLFIAGDAAHTHSPAGGQGMNTGIQDATNLGWKLALAAGAPAQPSATLLDSYKHERRPVARRVLALTRAVFWLEASTGPAATALRRSATVMGPTLLPPLLHIRRPLATGVRTLGQLRTHYRGSPLSITGPRRPRGWPRAGERLGDRPVMTDAGPRHLHDLVDGPGIALVTQRDARLGIPDTGPGLVRLHRLDRPGTGVMAVRPDGYVGFCGDDDARLLDQWLALVNAGTARARLT